MYSAEYEPCRKALEVYDQCLGILDFLLVIFEDVLPIFHQRTDLRFPVLSSQSPPCGVACYNTIWSIASYYSSLFLSISEGIYPDNAPIILSEFFDNNCLKTKSQYSLSFIPKKCPIDVDNALQLNTANICL